MRLHLDLPSTYPDSYSSARLAQVMQRFDETDDIARLSLPCISLPFNVLASWRLMPGPRGSCCTETDSSTA